MRPISVVLVDLAIPRKRTSDAGRLSGDFGVETCLSVWQRSFRKAKKAKIPTLGRLLNLLETSYYEAQRTF